MKRDPMKGYRAPDYPHRDEVDGGSLGRHFPARWKRSGAVATGMAMLFGAPAAHGDATTPPKSGAGPAGGADGKAGADGKDGVHQANLPAVFEHGEGRGAFGCVAVSPPAFLTEADARQVILEEFAKAGVSFELDRMKLEAVREREVTSTYRELDPKKDPKGRRFEEVTKEKDLGPATLDGWEPGRRIGFEYISEADYFKVGGARSASTVQEYDFRALAKRMAQDARRDKSVRIGVFYDPMAPADWKADKHGNYHADDGGRAKKELRAQVRDFIAFLRQERVL